MIEQVPTFIKVLKEYFNNIRTKRRDSRRIYTKLLMMCDIELEDLVEMIKKDTVEYRLFMKRQLIIHYSTETTGWFIKLHLEINQQLMQ